MTDYQSTPINQTSYSPQTARWIHTSGLLGIASFVLIWRLRKDIFDRDPSLVRHRDEAFKFQQSIAFYWVISGFMVIISVVLFGFFNLTKFFDFLVIFWIVYALILASFWLLTTIRASFEATKGEFNLYPSLPFTNNWLSRNLQFRPEAYKFVTGQDEAHKGTRKDYLYVGIIIAILMLALIFLLYVYPVYIFPRI